MTHRVITAINVDFVQNPLGLPSRLAHALNDKPVLRHTVERALAIESAASTHLLCPVAQKSVVEALVAGLPVEIETHQAAPPPYQSLVQCSRAWGLDGWRGGIGSLCAFDEDCHIELLAALQQKTNADSILTIPAAAPLLDPLLLSAMIEHHVAQLHASEMTIVQAPPGLGGLIMSANTIAQLLTIAMPPGALLVYQPDSPIADLTGREGCYRPATEIVHASGRLLADSTRSWHRIERAVDAGALTWNAQELSQWLTQVDVIRVNEAPIEIEIELTTECQFQTTDLAYPRGDYVPSRGPLSLSAIDNIAAVCKQYDDTRIMLGGFGEPTLHPRFAEICHRLRSAGAFAIGVRSNGLAIPTVAESALFDAPVDVIEITLDAATPATYQRVHGRDEFETVVATLERLMQRRRASQSVRPLIVPSLIKCAETLNEMEAFVDRWQRAFGMYTVRGITDYGGKWHPERAIRFATSGAQHNGSQRTRCMILADGTVTTCDQDIVGKRAVGGVLNTDLQSIWKCEALDHAEKDSGVA